MVTARDSPLTLFFLLFLNKKNVKEEEIVTSYGLLSLDKRRGRTMRSIEAARHELHCSVSFCGALVCVAAAGRKTTTMTLPPFVCLFLASFLLFFLFFSLAAISRVWNASRTRLLSPAPHVTIFRLLPQVFQVLSTVDSSRNIWTVIDPYVRVKLGVTQFDNRLLGPLEGQLSIIWILWT